jgi:cell wall-associated NlpC family hydrolase
LLKAFACITCVLGGATLIGAPVADARVTPKLVRDLAQQHRTLETNLRSCAVAPTTSNAQRNRARSGLLQAQRRRVAAVRLVRAGRLPAARNRFVASRARLRADIARCRVTSTDVGLGFELPGGSGRAGAQPLGAGAPAPLSAPAGVPAGPAAQRVIAAAEARLGRPYSYGSTGPAAFDCSGLVWSAFRAAGITYPRTSTYDEWGSGIGPAWARSTDHAALRPGDIVYFRPSARGPGHSGVYVGGGAIIHASSGAGQVRRDTVVSGYYRTNFVGFLRHQSVG